LMSPLEFIQKRRMRVSRCLLCRHRPHRVQVVAAPSRGMRQNVVKSGHSHPLRVHHRVCTHTRAFEMRQDGLSAQKVGSELSNARTYTRARLDTQNTQGDTSRRVPRKPNYCLNPSKSQVHACPVCAIATSRRILQDRRICRQKQKARQSPDPKSEWRTQKVQLARKENRHAMSGAGLPRRMPKQAHSSVYPFCKVVAALQGGGDLG